MAAKVNAAVWSGLDQNNDDIESTTHPEKKDGSMAQLCCSFLGHVIGLSVNLPTTPSPLLFYSLLSPLTLWFSVNVEY